MNKKKIGTILVLFGVGMPIVLWFLQENGDFLRYKTQEETIKRKLTKKELNRLEILRKYYRSRKKIVFEREFKELVGEEEKKEFLDELATELLHEVNKHNY